MNLQDRGFRKNLSGMGIQVGLDLCPWDDDSPATADCLQEAILDQTEDRGAA